MNVATHLPHCLRHRVDRFVDLRDGVGSARVSGHAQQRRAWSCRGVSPRRRRAGVLRESRVQEVEGVVKSLVLSMSRVLSAAKDPLRKNAGDPSPLSRLRIWAAIRTTISAAAFATLLPRAAEACPVCFGGPSGGG